MKLYLSTTLFLFFFYPALQSQIQPENITIVRDKWGVPHVFGKTDAEVAYGFAWASAEDDFETMQEQLLPVKSLSGSVNGKDGAVLDVALQLFEVHQLVEERYEKDLSQEFRAYLEAFVAGVNAYAVHHPKEVRNKKLFPITGQDIIKVYVVGMSLMSHVHLDLGAILNGKVKEKTEKQSPKGSNALAVSAQKTKDGKTYIAINSHQPLEGPYSWYEAHLHSEEGLNILGGTFVGSPTIFLGTNENLAWAHTLNHADFSDVYELHMHPEEPLTYRFDGKWEKLAPIPIKTKVKMLGFFKIPYKQEFYKSKYGITFKTDEGFFALRFPANRDIRAAEQWFKMNKAKNFSDFKAALDMQGIICTNIVYADKDNHIYYIGNGRLPKRDPNFDWKEVLPGDTSATLWADEYYPIDSLPQVLDPASHYVYSCNHTPFASTGEKDNPEAKHFPKAMGYMEPDDLTNRAIRFKALIEQYDRLSYDDFKRIKYDRAYHTPLLAAKKLEPIFHLDPLKYIDISTPIVLLSSWDRIASKESNAASYFILAIYYINDKLKKKESFQKGDELTEALIVEALREAQRHLIRHFNKILVPLGTLQRLERGKVDLPVSGGPDVLAALAAQHKPNGRLKAWIGDSYIEFVRFSKDGVEIESINAYGASADPDSPHYTDQMNAYVNRKLKPMTLDKAKILKEASKTYHPK